MHRFLANSREVRQALARLFSKRTRDRRRVAVVAYVGRDAPALLPDWHRVELYCWPQAGATDPHALATLQRAPYRARVRLVDNLHSKLYWVEDEGYVVTSANLSQRALGDSIQSEVGVFSDNTTEVPIGALIRSLKSRPLQQAELKRLYAAHDRFWAEHTFTRRQPTSKARSHTFKDWVANGCAPEWKLGWWGSPGRAAPSTRQVARAEYGAPNVHDFIDCRAGDYRADDWMLTFRIRNAGSISSMDWLRVDIVHRLARHEVVAGYTHQAVQVRPLSPEHRPPFRLDRRFRAAFERVIKRYGVATIENARHQRPTRRLLAALKRARF